MDNNGPISAEEGADRVAERMQANRLRGDAQSCDDDAASEDDEHSTPAYTCENCGAHVFLFSRTCTLQRALQETLACSCGKTDIAVIRDLAHRRTITEVGRLGSDHKADFHDEEYGDETVDDEEWEEIDSEVQCSNCLQNAGEEDWETEQLEDWEEDLESLVCDLHCAECGHEIEFSWSYPSRGGRIWPCESADFKPKMSVPEERFLEAWKRRGWLRS